MKKVKSEAGPRLASCVSDTERHGGSKYKYDFPDPKLQIW